MLRHPHNVTFRDLHGAATERGWEHQRTEGSHYIYRKGDRQLTIPHHGYIAAGTIRSILRMLEGD